MRPSPASVFVIAAIAVAAAAGVSAKRASGANDDGLPLPVDAPAYGFAISARVNGVAILEATHDFRMDLSNGPVHGVAPNGARAAAAKKILARELARYPRDFLANARLAGVVLTDDLTESETPIPSLPNVAGLLLLDVAAAEIDLVRAVHHEVWHFVDLADDGVLSPDPTWRALNAPGTLYGSGGRSLRGAWAARPAEDLPGFVSAYATAGEEEDKAETFAFVVAHRPLPLARDAVLRAKVQELRRRVAAIDPGAPSALGFPDPT